MTESTTTTTIKVKAHYTLSPAGQREAIRRGLPSAAAQTIEGEVTHEYLSIADIDAAGVPSILVRSVYGRTYDEPQTWESYVLPDLRARLEALRVAEAALAAVGPTSAAFLADPAARRDDTTYTREKTRAVWRGVALDDDATAEAGRRYRIDQEAAEDVRIAAFLADPTARATIYSDDIVIEEQVEGIERGTNGHVALIRRAHPRWKEMLDEAQRRHRGDREREEEARLTRTRTKLAFLAGWIREQGTDDMRERQAAGEAERDDDQETRARIEALGLVPEDEVLAAIKEQVFAPLADERRYEQIRSSELDGPGDDDDEGGEDGYGIDYRHRKGDMECESEAANEASPGQWARVKAVRAKAPQSAVVVLRWHRCACTTKACAWGNKAHSVTRAGILVEITVTEGLTLHREYAC